MKLHYFQHEDFEDPGTILEWAAERRHPVTATMIYKGEPLPSLNSFDMLVIMGGGMSVYEEDRFPWLIAEKQFIRQAIDTGKAVFGICLGAQLIASALGAGVYKNLHKEIGWFPITMTPEGAASPLFVGWPKEFHVFQWHGDTFDIPAGAVKIASSKACENQAFAYGNRAVALQFHIESSAESVERLVTNCENEIVPGQPYIQSVEQIRSRKQWLPQIREILFGLLDEMGKNTTD
jgi:GMP synthase-like glutamine amidotransferase